MKLSHAEARALKRILREMVRAGDIVLTRKGLYGPSEEMSLLTGSFEAHRDGYGFVILEKPGERDVFVPARWTLGAMNNDRVMVRMEQRHRREGRIIRILERATTRIVGRLDIPRAASYVRPLNKAIPFDLYVAPHDRGKARQGDKVVAETTAYHTDKRPPTGKVLKVIEKPEDPKTEVEAIIEELNLPRKFPKAVHDEPFTIQPLSGYPSITDPVTIDGTTQPGFEGSPVIELDGSHAGEGAHGLLINARDSTIKGLVINRFSGNGINLEGGSGNTIQGNYIGTDLTGTTATSQPGPAVGEHTWTVVEACPTYPTLTEINGFVSDSDDALAPWSGTSVHFEGTDECGSPDVFGASSLISATNLNLLRIPSSRPSWYPAQPSTVLLL